MNTTRKSANPKAVIVVSGGVVQSVMANLDLDVEIIDYDTFEEDDFSGRKKRAADRRLEHLKNAKGWRGVI